MKIVKMAKPFSKSLSIMNEAFHVLSPLLLLAFQKARPLILSLIFLKYPLYSN